MNYMCVYSYVFSPKEHIKRWDEKKKKYTNLFINKCVICKRSSKCVKLIHICSFCNPYKQYFYGNKRYCENTLLLVLFALKIEILMYNKR